MGKKKKAALQPTAKQTRHEQRMRSDALSMAISTVPDLDPDKQCDVADGMFKYIMTGEHPVSLGKAQSIIKKALSPNQVENLLRSIFPDSGIRCDNPNCPTCYGVIEVKGEDADAEA